MQVLKIVKTWATGDGADAKTQETGEANGTIIGVTAIISSVTDNPTVSITLRDADDAIIVADALMTNLADGTKHIKRALGLGGTTDSDFAPVAVRGPITVSMDPSADPGGTAQTLTVQLRIFIRED